MPESPPVIMATFRPQTRGSINGDQTDIAAPPKRHPRTYLEDHLSNLERHHQRDTQPRQEMVDSFVCPQQSQRGTSKGHSRTSEGAALCPRRSQVQPDRHTVPTALRMHMCTRMYSPSPDTPCREWRPPPTHLPLQLACALVVLIHVHRLG